MHTQRTESRRQCEWEMFTNAIRKGVIDGQLSVTALKSRSQLAMLHENEVWIRPCICIL
jgi:hypothetical protein